MSTLDSDLRISTWNCDRTIKPKMVAFARLAADIVVLQEVREEDLWDFPGASSQRWIGPNGGAGLAVLGFNGWMVEAGPPCAEEWFLPVVVSRGDVRLKVLALWVKPVGGSYVTSAVRGLKSLEHFLLATDAVVIGDFNANASWDGTTSASQYGFRAQLALLSQGGFTSVWHHTHDEQHGSESEATRYQYRREALPYHVDYAFVSSGLIASVANVSLGTFKDWTGAKQSDHVPLSFDLRSAARAA
jgi:endonuclease/exonuclease/phosphatase family metal-dependent hydrolase